MEYKNLFSVFPACAFGREGMQCKARRAAQGLSLSKRTLAECGLDMPQGMSRLMSAVKCLIADEGNALPVVMRALAQRLPSHLLELDRQVQEIDNQVRQISRQSSMCRRLEQVPGIGPTAVTALEATVGEQIGTFKNGRQLAAFLGLVPKRHCRARS